MFPLNFKLKFIFSVASNNTIFIVAAIYTNDHIYYFPHNVIKV